MATKLQWLSRVKCPLSFVVSFVVEVHVQNWPVYTNHIHYTSPTFQRSYWLGVALLSLLSLYFPSVCWNSRLGLVKKISVFSHCVKASRQRSTASFSLPKEWSVPIFTMNSADSWGCPTRSNIRLTELYKSVIFCNARPLKKCIQNGFVCLC